MKEADRGALFERIATTFDQGDVIMTIAEQLRQEGFEKGRSLSEQFRQEGWHQGSRKEKLATARRLLALEICEETILQVT